MMNAPGIHRVHLSMEMADITVTREVQSNAPRYPGLVCPVIPWILPLRQRRLLQLEAV